MSLLSKPVAHEYVPVLKNDGAGLTEFEEAENFGGFFVLNDGRCGFPDEKFVFNIPCSFFKVHNISVNAGLIGVSSASVKCEKFVSAYCANARSLTSDTRIHGFGERFSVIVRDSEMVIHSLTRLDIFIPADNNNRAVFKLAASLLIACYAIALEFHANGIVIPCLSFVRAVQKSAAKTNVKTQTVNKKPVVTQKPATSGTGSTVNSGSSVENGYWSGSLGVMSPSIRNFFML